MTKFASLAIAATVSLATIAAIPSTAMAGGHHHGDVFAAGALGFLGGAIVAGALTPRQPVYVNVGDSHDAWCSAKYRSYNAYDNTWVDRHGRLHLCVSPYDY